MPPSPDTAAEPAPARAITLLALAAFASQAMVRVADPLLPQIAADIDTTVGFASVVSSAYALAHGTTQLFGSPLGDRFPKYALVTILCALCAVATAACGLSTSLTTLGIARLLCGLTAGMIIPLSMAFIGDAVAYDKRQPVLARYLSGQILGLVGGQIIGGVIGDHFGWRNTFFFLAGLFVLSAVALALEMRRNPMTRRVPQGRSSGTGLFADYALVLRTPWARFVILAVFLEAAMMFGAFAFIGADLHLRQGLSFSAVGGVLSAFGIGGMIYVLGVSWLVNRLGQVGLVIAGGVLLALANLFLAAIPQWWMAFVCIAVIGLGFYMMHNTLQVNATQMVPQARATAIGVFASSFYLGQGIGVALAAPVVDGFGTVPIFLFVTAGWPLLTWWIAMRLRRREAKA